MLPQRPAVENPTGLESGNLDRWSRAGAGQPAHLSFCSLLLVMLIAAYVLLAAACVWRLRAASGDQEGSGG
jgi:hypothetical protein